MKLKFIQRKKMFCQKENLKRKGVSHTHVKFLFKIKICEKKKHDLLVVPQTPV